MTKPTEEILLHESKPTDASSIACHVREIIKLIGEDPEREGLRKTPERYEKAMRFLTSGYHQNVDHLLNGATFSVCYDEMVLVKDIEFFSLCEHHLLPFFGKAHIAYLPDQEGHRVEQSGAPGQHVRAAAADSRAYDQPDRQGHRRKDCAAGRWRNYRGPAPVHADARSREAARAGRDQRDAGRIPQQQANPRRVSVAGAQQTKLRTTKSRIARNGNSALRTLA